MRALHPLARADEVRRRVRARGPLPPGADGHEHAQRLRGSQERAQADRVLPPRRRGDPRANLRVDDLPRAADACRRRSSRATRSKQADNLRKAAAKKKRDLMAAERSKFVSGCEETGYDASFAEQDVRHHRAVRRLLVPEGARHRIRLHHVPNRVAQGELPGASISRRCSRASRPTSTRRRSTSTSAGCSTSRCSSPT